MKKLNNLSDISCSKLFDLYYNEFLISQWKKPETFNDHNIFAERWFELGKNSYSKCAAFDIQYYIFENIRTCTFNDKFFPILEKGYIKAKARGSDVTFMSQFAFWKLITDYNWFFVTKILEITYKYSDNKFDKLCAKLCYSNYYGGFKCINIEWFNDFVVRTSSTHKKMWISIITKYNGNRMDNPHIEWNLLQNFENDIDDKVLL